MSHEFRPRYLGRYRIFRASIEWLRLSPLVIARCAKRAVAIQPLDRARGRELVERLDCFVAALLAMTVAQWRRES